MACQRQEDADFRLPDTLEEIADDNLCAYQREYGYGNAYASGSNVYQLFIAGKDGGYGMGEQFADKEAGTGDTYSGNDGQAQGGLHTVVYSPPRSVPWLLPADKHGRYEKDYILQ